jgi:hypothetical protein
MRIAPHLQISPDTRKVDAVHLLPQLTILYEETSLALDYSRHPETRSGNCEIYCLAQSPFGALAGDRSKKKAKGNCCGSEMLRPLEARPIYDRKSARRSRPRAPLTAASVETIVRLLSRQASILASRSSIAVLVLPPIPAARRPAFKIPSGPSPSFTRFVAPYKLTSCRHPL